MAIAFFNDIIVQVHCSNSTIDQSLRYYVRWFDGHKSNKELTLKYLDGTFVTIKGEATERETAMLAHCIQALELSEVFRR